MKNYAILEYDGERYDTEIPRSACGKYLTTSSFTGGEYDEDHRACHFEAFEPGCSAGRILPVDLDHPANARLIWRFYNPEYAKRVKAAFSCAFGATW